MTRPQSSNVPSLAPLPRTCEINPGLAHDVFTVIAGVTWPLACSNILLFTSLPALLRSQKATEKRSAYPLFTSSGTTVMSPLMGMARADGLPGGSM